MKQKHYIDSNDNTTENKSNIIGTLHNARSNMTSVFTFYVCYYNHNSQATLYETRTHTHTRIHTHTHTTAHSGHSWLNFYCFTF